MGCDGWKRCGDVEDVDAEDEDAGRAYEDLFLRCGARMMGSGRSSLHSNEEISRRREAMDGGDDGGDTRDGDYDQILHN